MENETFHIQTYGLQELALKYFPKSTPASASTQLKRWMKTNRGLRKEIIHAGYHSGQRLLTPKQVSIIIQYLGEPG